MDSSFDMLFLVGSHAMVGTQGVVRDHSYNRRVEIGLKRTFDKVLCDLLERPAGIVSKNSSSIR